MARITENMQENDILAKDKSHIEVSKTTKQPLFYVNTAHTWNQVGIKMKIRASQKKQYIAFSGVRMQL